MDRFPTDLLTGYIDRAVESLAGRNGAQMVTDTRARTISEQLAQRSYQTGRDAAIRELSTTSDVADALSVTPAWVRRLATRHNIGWEIGRDRLFRPEDVVAMRVAAAAAVRTGRPARNEGEP